MNQQEFINKCNKVHDNFYDYSETDYKGSVNKVEIICRLHGKFTQLASNHLSGSGCKSCGRVNTIASRKSSTTDFINSAIQKHGDRYDYSISEYTKSKAKIKITCKLHGTFSQTATDHLAGKGCKTCSTETGRYKEALTTDSFISLAAKVHNDKYDYTDVLYTGSKSKVKIKCEIHGVFEQQPDNHIHGQGCPSCAKSGYDPKKIGYLYILKYENITKIGITNLSARERCRDISKSFGKQFSIELFIRFENGCVPDKVETKLLQELREMYDRPNVKFEGSTEAFLNVDYNDLLLRITNLVSINLQEI